VTEKSLGRLVRDGVFWLTAVKLSGQLLSWAITVYVMRILSPDDYGLVAMAGVFIGFVVLFNEFGLSAAIVQRKELEPADLSGIFWSVLCINLTLYGACFVSAPAVAAFYDEPRLVDVMRMAALTFIFRSIGLVSNNMLAREMTFNRQSQAALIGNAAGALATLLLAMEGAGVWSLVYGSLISEGTANVLLILFYPWKPAFAFSFSRVRLLIQFGYKVAVARLFWYFSSNMDLLIAGKVLSRTQIGYYAVAVQFALIPLDKIVSTVAQVAFPAFSKVQGDAALLRRYYLKIANLVSFVIFPICWGIFLVAESAVPLLLSDKWRPIVLPLQILSMVTSLRALHILNAPLETALGRPGVTICNFAIITVILSASFIIGAGYDLEGLAYAWLVFPVVFLITTSITLRLIKLPLVHYFRELRHPFLGTAFMVIAVLTVQTAFLAGRSHATHAAGTVAVGTLAYLLYFAIFDRQIFTEARQVFRK
jgi:teichuronic acid exporter